MKKKDRIKKLKIKLKECKDFDKDLQTKQAGMTEFDPRILIALYKMDEKDKKEFCERLVQNTFKIEKTVMTEIYREGILTKEEYEKDFKHKYIDSKYGGDSFPEFMQSVLFNKRNPKEKIVFVTTNTKILKDKKSLSKRFKIMIKSPKEAIGMIKKEGDEITDVFQAM